MIRAVEKIKGAGVLREAVGRCGQVCAGAGTLCPREAGGTGEGMRE